MNSSFFIILINYGISVNYGILINNGIDLAVIGFGLAAMHFLNQQTNTNVYYWHTVMHIYYHQPAAASAGEYGTSCV